MDESGSRPLAPGEQAATHPVIVDRATLPDELEELAAFGESLLRRTAAAAAGRSLEEACTVVPFDDGVAVVRPVRGGATIFVGADRTVLFQTSAVGFSKGVTAFRAGERTQLDRFPGAEVPPTTRRHRLHPTPPDDAATTTEEPR